jgi:hypothetical protein
MDRNPNARKQARGVSEMTTVELTARYARYLLTSLATVAIGMNMN